MRGLKVAVIKHDGHDFVPDVPGTDSYRHKAAGAVGTIVYSENRFCLVKEEKGHEAEDFLPFFQDMDLILVEGLKDSHYAKIEVMRRDVSKKGCVQKRDCKGVCYRFQAGYMVRI